MAILDNRLLDAAIMTQFSAGGDFATALTNGLWNSQAPQGTAYPFAVFQIIDIVPEYLWTNERFETLRVRFSIFDNATNSTAAELLRTYQKQMFDEQLLSVTGFTTLYFDRVLELTDYEPIERIWSLHTDYKVVLST